MTDTIVTDFDIVFALHTGVTIMMQQQSAFDDCITDEIPFHLSDPDTGEIRITPPNTSAVIVKNVKSDMMVELKERGFFMIYELDGDDIARCTPCSLVR